MARPAATRATLEAGRRVGRRPALLAARRASVIAIILLAALPALASAHAQLLSVDPADGSLLPTSPPAVTITFNERVGLATGGLRVVDASGAVVDQGEDVVDGERVSQPLPPLADGWYVVTWGIISTDGHVVRASSAFGVGDADAAARPPLDSTGAPPLQGIVRFVGDLALLVAAGAWLAIGLLGARARRVRILALTATAIALAGTVAWGSVVWADAGDAWLGTPAATFTVVRGVLLAIALVPAGISLVVPVGSVVLALVTLAGGGHSAGDPWSMLLLSTHLVAAVVWLGAAPAVLLTLRDAAVTDAEAEGVVRRFSRSAGFALVVLGAAGAALTWNLSDGLAGGFSTPWLLIMVAKVGVVAVAAILGALGRRHLGRSPDRRSLRRLFLVDAGLLVLVAALSSGLTLTSPHVGHAGHGTGGSGRCAADVGDGSVSVILSPARTGTNEVLLGGIPAGSLSVNVDFRHVLTEGGALTMAASEGAVGWTATGPLPFSGAWDVTLRIRVDTFTSEQGTCQVRIEP